MENFSIMSLSVFSVFAFCGCAYFFIRSMMRPVPIFSVTTGYSKQALRIRKGYTVFAWGVMTSVFLVALVYSFIDVFTHL